MEEVECTINWLFEENKQLQNWNEFNNAMSNKILESVTDKKYFYKTFRLIDAYFAFINKVPPHDFGNLELNILRLLTQLNREVEIDRETMSLAMTDVNRYWGMIFTKNQKSYLGLVIDLCNKVCFKFIEGGSTMDDLLDILLLENSGRLENYGIVQNKHALKFLMLSKQLSRVWKINRFWEFLEKYLSDKSKIDVLEDFDSLKDDIVYGFIMKSLSSFTKKVELLPERIDALINTFIGDNERRISLAKEITNLNYLSSDTLRIETRIKELTNVLNLLKSEKRKELELKIETLESKFNVHKIKPDGNCLFRAVSLHIAKNTTHYANLRRDAVEYVIQNWEELGHEYFPGDERFDHFKKNRDRQDEDPKLTYRAYMIRNQIYGGERELIALSRRYRICIKIYNEIFKKWENPISPEFEKDTCYLRYSGLLDSGHYEYLTLINKSKDGDKGLPLMKEILNEDDQNESYRIETKMKKLENLIIQEKLFEEEKFKKNENLELEMKKLKEEYISLTNIHAKCKQDVEELENNDLKNFLIEHWDFFKNKNLSVLNRMMMEYEFLETLSKFIRNDIEIDYLLKYESKIDKRIIDYFKKQEWLVNYQEKENELTKFKNFITELKDLIKVLKPKFDLEEYIDIKYLSILKKTVSLYPSNLSEMIESESNMIPLEKYDDLKDKYDDLMRRNTEKNIYSNDLKNRIIDYEKENESLKYMIDDYKMDFESYMRESKNLKDEIRDKAKEIEKSKDKHNDELEILKFKKNDIIDALNLKLEEYKNEVNNLEEINNSMHPHSVIEEAAKMYKTLEDGLRTELADADTEIKNLKSKRIESDIKNIDELKLLNNKIERLNENSNEAEKEIKKLKSQLSIREDEFQKLKWEMLRDSKINLDDNLIDENLPSERIESEGMKFSPERIESEEEQSSLKRKHEEEEEEKSKKNKSDEEKKEKVYWDF